MSVDLVSSLGICLGLAFWVYFWFSLDYFVLELLGFVVSGLVSLVLGQAKRLAGKNFPKWPVLCRVDVKP